MSKWKESKITRFYVFVNLNWLSVCVQNKKAQNKENGVEKLNEQVKSRVKIN